MIDKSGKIVIIVWPIAQLSNEKMGDRVRCVFSNAWINFSQGDGKISVLELKNALNTIDDERSEEEIKEMINKADPSVEGNSEISYSEFMGVMAEADFYFLFKG